MSKIKEISIKLFEMNMFHKINKNFIITKRRKVSVPKLNKDVAYLIGVITGDGSMIRSRRKKGGYHYIIKITSYDKKYLQYLNQLFLHNFNINGIIMKDKRKDNTYDLFIQNAPVFWYFILIGLEIGKKMNPSIPTEIERNDKLFLHYLAGLSDTDGYLSGRRIHLKQKSKDFLDKIIEKLKELSINVNPSKVNYTNSKPFYYIRFDNNLLLRYALVAQVVEHPKR